MYVRFIRWLGKYVTANQITIFRGVIAIPAILFWIYGDYSGKYLALFIMIASWILDRVDGDVARICNQMTGFGKRLDPAIDKLIIFPFLAIFWPVMDKRAFIALLVLDAASTFIRGRKEDKEAGANWFGKWKLGFQVSATALFAGSELLPWLELLREANRFLWIATILAFVSVGVRSKAYRWLPNFLTIGNAGCGIASVYFSWQGNFLLAGELIFLGMVLDFIDGPLARKMKTEGKLGVVLDDIADGMTFGVATGVLIATRIGSWPGYYLGVMYIAATIYRLVDFTRTKSGHEKPPEGSFRGMPSPSGAWLVVSIIFLFSNSWIIAFGAAISMLGMISFSRFWIHFGKIFSNLKTGYGATLFILTAIGLYYLPYQVLFGLGLIYALFGSIPYCKRLLVYHEKL